MSDLSAVHFGTMDVGPLADAILLLLPTALIDTYGDGWNVWGDEVGSAGNDPFGQHVVVITRTEAEARMLFEEVPAQHGDLVISMSSPEDFGTVAVLTERTDWSEASASAERPTCPRCGLFVPDEWATSRLDSATHLCSACERVEAFEDFALAGILPKSMWARPTVGA